MQLECLFLGFARAVAGLGLCVPALAGDQPTVRIHDQETRGARVTEPDSLGAGTAALGAGAPCGIMTRAWHNQPIPGGGTLNPVAFANPAAVSSSGRILFISLANGALRNQGLFTADEQHMGVAALTTTGRIYRAAGADDAAFHYRYPLGGVLQQAATERDYFVQAVRSAR